MSFRGFSDANLLLRCFDIALCDTNVSPTDVLQPRTFCNAVVADDPATRPEHLGFEGLLESSPFRGTLRVGRTVAHETPFVRG
jgi:hypothetical protein